MGDCISRQAVEEIINDIRDCISVEGYWAILERMKKLPSVTPKQKVGKWIYTKAVSTGEIIWSECSVCGEGEHGCAKRMKYCHNCGAQMEEGED